MSNFINVFTERQDQLWQALFEHIQISFIALLFAVLISIPLGIYLTKKGKIAEPIIGIAAVLQTIPSLALLGLFIPLFGIGKFPAIIALILYALLPILRNTYTGIREVDPSLIEAATAMGMNTSKRLLKVELPLAMPVIMAGIRTSMVLIVGTATLAALIGAGGLGDIILLGIDRNNTSLIVLGAIPAALLAILFDILLRKMETFSFKQSLLTITIILLISVLFILTPLLLKSNNDTVVIGGKLGTEPEILINMYQLLIEEQSDIEVELEPGLGKTSFLYNALKTSSIDIYPEFTGTALTQFLKEQANSNKKEEVYQQAKQGLKEKFDLVMLSPMQYNNTYALAVPEEFANNYNLEAISDLHSVEGEIKAGFTLEFSDREDGYLGIQDLYNLSFSNLKTMEPQLRYAAVEEGDINLIDAYSTDSELKRYNLKVLEDDKQLFPPYQGAPLLRQETLDEHPELANILNQLAGKITDDQMRDMNYQVAVEGKSAQEVAREYLENEGLLPAE
ncbi:osmoprotectant update ABC transporter permease/substrate-binding subunit OpuFB [Gracilibacillus salinarum]|uniref:Osmoprotectant update ABC transporter permease/substrate-binding subunit OpuFB n=1 Tax=Gracilibacillus salinarum TaxID=2932255 RepID=A0ABY4GJC0_9BACI|nr:osmoprotectant update ABC transporter permease/substrate-binding subunit OpuFB [Gracilibacillus salinarum]UOQ84095.1 osmoprotectant update ABC transporter permease/substrate-binding subunit OpuFB [Gracilibacillus salinarum]